MYKFTNGVVVFTEEDKENFLKAGYILEKEENNAKKEDSVRVINEKFKRGEKTTSKFRR